jgi:hypothetical protein
MGTGLSKHGFFRKNDPITWAFSRLEGKNENHTRHPDPVPVRTGNGVGGLAAAAEPGV